ncbi:MAG: S8/S53 family peptidase [Mycobacteriales bacterium]|nr:S8/S53 family peptidase [Mycobacteriales bacterium]
MRLRSLLTVATAAVVAVPGLAALDTADAAPTRGVEDMVVVAVLDSGMSPYHLDYRASEMPQAKTASKADDLPLSKAPHTWVEGFPSTTSFASYGATRLTLDTEPTARMDALQQEDADAWDELQTSEVGKPLHYTWFPGTKVIGAVSFSDTKPLVYGTGGGEHGQGTSSVSVGNRFGSCPECLLVFLQTPDAASYEAGIQWAQKQPWIDAISVSLGINASGVVRDRIYEGSDVQLARQAVERGQTAFFSGGNGLENAFVAPQSTLLNSQNGPDWAVTVGAIDPSGNNFSGNGKPTEIASLGLGYPSSYTSTTISNGGDFSGTSNATPVIAGTYARALWKARTALAGASRVQSKGVIAKGPKLACGAARRGCELGDGVLTQPELLERLYKGATPTDKGTTPLAVAGLGSIGAPHVADERFASEGHGVYWARERGEDKWQQEFDDRLWGVLRGVKAAPERPAGEVEWFRVESYCRQEYWGRWKLGAFRDANSTPLPAADPDYPTRSALLETCPSRSNDG